MSPIPGLNMIAQTLAEKFGTKEAVSDDRLSLSYNELWQKVKNAASLLKKNVHKGDTVLIELGNCAEFIVAFFSVIHIGAVPVLMHMKLNSHEREPIIRLCRPVCRIRHERTPENKDISVITATELISQGKVNDCTAARLTLGDTAFILLSSGTTGIPKCIPKTYGEITTFLNSFIKCVGFDEGTRSMATGPLTHYLGFVTAFATLISGGTIFLSEFLSPVDIISAVSEEEINTLSMVPSMLRLCTEYCRLDEECCKLSRSLLIAGSKSTGEDIHEGIRCFGCPVICLYGSSEAVATYSVYNTREDTLAYSEGIPIGRFDKMMIEGSANEGELLVKGPYVFGCYLGMEKEREKFFTPEGYYRTGDLASIDSGGKLIIIGRCREMINRCGEKIIPDELESLIQKHCKVCECAVCGLKDKVMGERIAAFIKLKDEVKILSSHELREHLTECGIADFKMPDDVIITHSMPKTDSGKINKRKLVEKYLERKDKKCTIPKKDS